eukprot:1806203-Prymnesium_polylepis.2
MPVWRGPRPTSEVVDVAPLLSAAELQAMSDLSSPGAAKASDPTVRRKRACPVHHCVRKQLWLSNLYVGPPSPTHPHIRATHPNRLPVCAARRPPQPLFCRTPNRSPTARQPLANRSPTARQPPPTSPHTIDPCPHP